MQSKSARLLLIGSGVLLAAIGFFLAGSWFTKLGSSKTTGGTSSLKPPTAVGNPDRVRQNLQPGKTYATLTKGTLHLRATDKDWGLEEVITINYVFEARIDREIEANDGTTVVELRHFRNVHSLKLETRIEDVRIELGPATEGLLVGAGLVWPQIGPIAGVAKVIEGTSLKPLLQVLRLSGYSPDRLLQDRAVKAVVLVDRLSGKSVRLTYVDGRGVIKVEPVVGEMTSDERAFHQSSVLVSDSLILPKIEIPQGVRWNVDGSNFANIIDPGLLAMTSGTIELERAPDHIVNEELCRHIRVVGGRLLFESSNESIGQIGYFEPQGFMEFSPTKHVFVQGEWDGVAEMERFSKDHLLFECRMRRRPKLVVSYSCKVIDTSRQK